MGRTGGSGGGKMEITVFKQLKNDLKKDNGDRRICFKEKCRKDPSGNGYSAVQKNFIGTLNKKHSSLPLHSHSWNFIWCLTICKMSLSMEILRVA